jgi:hypothetical protein
MSEGTTDEKDDVTLYYMLSVNNETQCISFTQEMANLQSKYFCDIVL